MEKLEDVFVSVSKWVSLIVGSLGWLCQDFWLMQWCIDFVKFRARLRAGWVWLFCVKCQTTGIGMWSQHRDRHWTVPLVFLCCDVESILKILEGRDYGNKPFRFDVPGFECNWGVTFFASCSWGSKKSLRAALFFYIYNLLVKFLTYDNDKSVFMLVQLFKRVAHSGATLIKNRVSKSRSAWCGVVLRATSFWWARPEVGWFLWSLCAELFFVFNLLWLFYWVFFSFLFWLCPLLKNRITFFGFVFRFFCFLFYFFLIFKVAFEKKIIPFQSGLLRLGYRGTFFLRHAVSLLFCGVSKLRCLVYNSLPTGLEES